MEQDSFKETEIKGIFSSLISSFDSVKKFDWQKKKNMTLSKHSRLKETLF